MEIPFVEFYMNVYDDINKNDGFLIMGSLYISNEHSIRVFKYRQEKFILVVY